MLSNSFQSRLGEKTGHREAMEASAEKVGLKMVGGRRSLTACSKVEIPKAHLDTCSFGTGRRKLKMSADAYTSVR